MTFRPEEGDRVRVRRTAYMWAIGTVTVVFAAGSSILTSAILTRRSEQKLCAVVVTADDAYRESPPQTEPGKRQAENYVRLRKDLGCQPYSGDPK